MTTIRTAPRPAALILASLLAGIGAASGQSPSASRIVVDTVHAASLEKNVYGDSPDRPVLVYLPPSYAANSARRYPVVYLLHGYGASERAWVGGYGGFNIQHAMDSLIAAGVASEMIVVMPNARNRLGGTFYTNSSAAGNWEDFVTRELVRHVDGTYRTIARPESRGLGGHSMGGYGTFALGMRYAGEVYGALYAMSACCTAPPSPTPSRAAWRVIASVPTLDSVARLPFLVRATVALDAAFAPNPSRPPLFIEPALDSGAAGWTLHDDVRRLWTANAPQAMIPAYASRLQRLRGLAFDVGTSDDLVSPAALAAMDSALTKAGVRHTFETYDGDHNNRVAERMVTRFLPFFSRALVFDK
jgi:S-formylglutathione hydrolase FrmB